MQKLISKYGLAAHLALLAVAPLIVFPYLSCEDGAKAVLWLSMLVLAWFVNAPSRINKERSTSEARRRISAALVIDPVFWILLVATVVSAIRALNNGITLAYDAESYLWYMTEPIVSILPASTEGAGLPVFVSTFIALTVYMVARHALGKSARIALVYLLGLFFGIAGLIALYKLVLGDELVSGFARCAVENPSFVGIGFGIMFVMIVAVLPLAFERRWNIAIATFPIAIGGSLAALLAFSPAYMALGYIFAALLVFAYCMFWTFKKLGKSKALKIVMIFVISLIFTLVLIYATAYKPVVQKFTALASGMLTAADAEISSKLTAISMKVWKVRLWLGAGLGTFPQQFRFNATDADWAVISVGQLSPLNGWSYLLAERGIIGALLMAVPAVALLWGYADRAIKAVKEIPSPLVFVGPLVSIVAFAFNAFNTSLFRIEAIPLLVLAVALSTNSWAKEKIDGQ